MRTSPAAALFILLPTAAGTGLVAPDFLLLFQRFKLRRNRIQLVQKRLAHIFMRKIHREELLPQILHSHIAAGKHRTHLRTDGRRLRLLVAIRAHCQELARRISAIGEEARVVHIIHPDLCKPLNVILIYELYPHRIQQPDELVQIHIHA